MKHFLLALVLLAAASGFAAADLDDVLVYPVRDEGSIMHWLQIAPLPWNAAYIGDSQSYDPFKPFGMSELELRPRAGDKVGRMIWRSGYAADGVPLSKHHPILRPLHLRQLKSKKSVNIPPGVPR